jgi:hypothetical protein
MLCIHISYCGNETKKKFHTHNMTLKYNISSQLYFNLSNKEEEIWKDQDCDDWKMCGKIYSNLNR